MAETIISPAQSLDGWKFSEWFKGNWKSIKELLKVGVPFVIGMLVTPNPSVVAIITIVGKLLIDTGEYYFTTITEK